MLPASTRDNEGRTAEDDHEIVTGKLLANLGDRGAEGTEKIRMVGWEGNSCRLTDQEHRNATDFRELHSGLPPKLGIDVWPHHEERILRGVQAIGECPELILLRYWLRCHVAADKRGGLIFVGLGSPVIERNRDKDRTGWSRRGEVRGPGDHCRHGCGIGSFEGPLNEGTRQVNRVAARKLTLQRKHGPNLLAAHDNKRSPKHLSIDESTHGLANSGGCMKAHEHRPSGYLAITVGHRETCAFVQRQNIAEVARQAIKERKFVGTRVAKYGGHRE